MSVRYSFCKHTSEVHPPSSPYMTQKIRQIRFSCKGRRPRNKKTKGVAENQRNVWLWIAESRKPGFLDKIRLCIHPLVYYFQLQNLYFSTIKQRPFCCNFICGLDCSGLVGCYILSKTLTMLALRRTFLFTCSIPPLGDRQCQAVSFCSCRGWGRANGPPGGGRGRATRPSGGGRGRATRPHLLTVCNAPDRLLSSGEFYFDAITSSSRG